MKWMLGLLLVGPLTASAEESTFWRVRSASTAVVTTIDMNGRIAWSNSVPGNNEQVQRATAIFPVANWQDYVLVPATGTTTSVTAFDLHPPANMALIPEGKFVMGATTNAGHESYSSDERPQHTVYVSAFYMDQYEVTEALWYEVKDWADTNGYLINWGLVKTAHHPIYYANWYDVVKWCNARSEKEGLAPCYTTNGVTYKTGDNSNVVCNWSANGYRLPTEAEWEKAARGGVADTRFPWTDYTNRISHAKANYYGLSGSFSYDLSSDYHPLYQTGDMPYSSPVGSFAPNGYGLYDMAGNMREWVWDWYGADYYSSSPSTNPSGAASGLHRVLRGGSWLAYVDQRCASRSRNLPDYESSEQGFRCVRRK